MTAGLSEGGDVAKVRRLGTDAIHVVELSEAPPAFLTSIFGAPAVCIEAPAVVACGAVLRDRRGGLVVMHADQTVTCITCRRWLGPRLARGYRVFDPEPVERALPRIEQPALSDDLLPHREES